MAPLYRTIVLFVKQKITGFFQKTERAVSHEPKDRPGNNIGKVDEVDRKTGQHERGRPIVPMVIWAADIADRSPIRIRRIPTAPPRAATTQPRADQSSVAGIIP